MRISRWSVSVRQPVGSQTLNSPDANAVPRLNGTVVAVTVTVTDWNVPLHAPVFAKPVPRAMLPPAFSISCTNTEPLPPAWHNTVTGTFTTAPRAPRVAGDPIWSPAIGGDMMPTSAPAGSVYAPAAPAATAI